jgi:uncharacterized caspase-like protein
MRLLPVVALTLILLAQPSWAEKRIALVIGNSSYTFAPLPNPENDADLMSRTLKGLGFDVITAINATQKNMKKSIKAFGKKLNTAGREGVGLFFYAGHGVQVRGANYMIPTDAQIETEGDVDIDAINAQSVLSMMEFSGAQLSFIIMDACRNNPFKRSFRSATRGLAKMEAPTGSLIAYATAPGDVASDGTGSNSPYTIALAKLMKTPGLSVERMFREVRNNVRSDTNDKQTPWESSSLTGGDFYFRAGPVTSQTFEDDTNSAPDQEGGTSAEVVFWQSIKDSKDPDMYQEYISQFPTGQFAGLARLKMKKLKERNSSVVAQKPSIQPISGEQSFVKMVDDYYKKVGIPEVAPHRYIIPTCQGCDPVVLYCVTKLKTATNLYGLRIRSSLPKFQKVLRGYGANPQVFPLSELYTALQRRVLDCTAN